MRVIRRGFRHSGLSSSTLQVKRNPISILKTKIINRETQWKYERKNPARFEPRSFYYMGDKLIAKRDEKAPASGTKLLA